MKDNSHKEDYPFPGLSQEEMERMLQEIKFQVDDFLRQTMSKLLSIQDNSPYRVLGLDPSAPDEVVKLVYLHLAKRLHPDMPGGNAQVMTRINGAYDEIAKKRGWK